MRMRTRLMALPLIAGLTLGLGSLASADTTSDALAGMTWVAAQTNPDGSLSSYEDFPDPGLMLDATLGGVASGLPDTTIDGWLSAIERLSGPSFAERVLDDAELGTSRDHGMIGKALVATAAAGHSTSSFAGINPQKLAAESFTDPTMPGHAAGTNAFGQSYIMIGLARTGTLPANTVTFLTGQQCASGAWPMFFDADPAKHCDVAKKSPDPDGTAMIVMALRAAQAKGITAAKAPLDKAVSWLKSQQLEDGSYTGALPFTPSPNTNSTGLVAAALADLEPTVVSRIGSWVKTLQLTGANNTGAVAYDKQAFDRAVDGNISAVGRGQWLRATTQASFALAPVDFYRLGAAETPTPSPKPTVTTPTPVAKFVRTAPYTLAGEHTVNGRLWKTQCEPYSRTDRCRTEIWATVVSIENGQFVRKNGWVFNNLTYLPYMTEAAWQGNPLAADDMDGFTSGGREWRTECHTAQTGTGACRSYTLTTVYGATAKPAGGYTFSQSNQWVFNNIVMFGGPEKR
ncbi:terpene cyclase/mutase family protein [Tessaracoccus sp. MC1756]|uniref:terpene cyclase/mutase family protein n=1 Tax=Tessaracoccus sp. MC1756 TaxID=2760311 RepID=UPI0016003930|nr:terpene cyclase/mutase family protein [Tessaracoccus sp. MC1756]MBB1510818.1 terpene cyclase/mutase family protein [Tessaracoccus sp. MC1756]